MATEHWVIRLPRTDQIDQSILVHVSRKEGGLALDLDLLATDGDSAYRTKVRDRKLQKLRFTGYEGTPEEWSNILHHAFVQPSSTQLSETLRTTLKIACAISVKGNKQLLTITIRQSVEEITHKFGAIELAHSQDTDDIDLFSWSSEVAQQRDSLASELNASNCRVKKAEDTINSLREQLQSLVTVKEEHEKQMVSKFALLLNEKKLRIRSQQRQIVQQDLDPAAISPSTIKMSKKRRTKPTSNHVAENHSEAESEGFDAMDVDEDELVDNMDSGDGKTPSASDTASEAEENSAPRPLPIKASIQDESLPPPRQLPFGPNLPNLNGSAEAKSGVKPISVPDADDDATASEDDEL